MSDVTYAYYQVFRAAPSGSGGSETPTDTASIAHEVEILFKEWADRVSVRGVYSSVGFRPDSDLLMWWVASSPDEIQDLMVAFRRTALGQRVQLARAFMGVVRDAEFSKDHLPAFVRGESPKTYVSVYPFVRTTEWYLLPPEERAAMLRDHGEIGREFPDVLANTTSAFGLNDWEWILAFEAEDLSRIVDCLRRLRQAKARAYTKKEVPFVIGIRKDLADVVRDLT